MCHPRTASVCFCVEWVLAWQNWLASFTPDQLIFSQECLGYSVHMLWNYAQLYVSEICESWFRDLFDWSPDVFRSTIDWVTLFYWSGPCLAMSWISRQNAFSELLDIQDPRHDPVLPSLDIFKKEYRLWSLGQVGILRSDKMPKSLRQTACLQLLQGG